MISINETTFNKIDLPEKVYKYRNWENSKTLPTIFKRLFSEYKVFACL
jgi:hypothetical protein